MGMGGAMAIPGGYGRRVRELWFLRLGVVFGLEFV